MCASGNFQEKMECNNLSFFFFSVVQNAMDTEKKKFSLYYIVHQSQLIFVIHPVEYHLIFCFQVQDHIHNQDQVT
jgi:hypothetical protein